MILNPALTLVACANTDESAQPAERAVASDSNVDSANEEATAIIDELNAVFEEAEANVEWEPGYYRDVYTRVLSGAEKLVAATEGGDNAQLALDATILRDQAQAMLDEEANFEQEDRPVQLENRYTRADMQLWRDRLAFAVENPDNLNKPTDGVEQVDQEGASANDAEFTDFETYSDKVGDFDLDFTVLPTGSFNMGGDEAEWERHDVDEYRQEWESPKHEVNITKRFGIMPTEVTREMFAAFVQDTGYATAPNGIGLPEPPETPEPTSSMHREGVTWQEPGIPQDSDKHPVVQVPELMPKHSRSGLVRRLARRGVSHQRRSGNTQHAQVQIVLTSGARTSTTEPTMLPDTTNVLVKLPNTVSRRSWKLMTEPSTPRRLAAISRMPGVSMT